jgi:hypothetical protein
MSFRPIAPQTSCEQVHNKHRTEKQLKNDDGRKSNKDRQDI